MIPNIIHFVFGMAHDFEGKPFSLVHYLSIRSAVELNKPSATIFHYHYEPEGEWWEKAKPLLTLEKINAPESFMGKRLYHAAHKADVVRLQALKATGGIYLDLDTISVRPLTELLCFPFVIGQEPPKVYAPKNWRQRIKYKLGLIRKMEEITGLCNAVLLSEKNNDFLNRWLEAYRSFRSKGHDKYWNEHSVKVPKTLADMYPNNVTRLSPGAFFSPLYDEQGLRSMFEEVTDFNGAYVHHLWETFSWDKYLLPLTPEKILSQDTTYNLIARKYIAR
jgi:hypothetical protein